MKAVSLHDGNLEVTDVPTPRPLAGQILLDVRRAGICGSDVHMRSTLNDSADAAAAVGYQMTRQDVVLGHEFVGEVAEYGRRTQRRWKSGTPVVALPIRRNGQDAHCIGVSAHAPGSYAEQLVVQESVTFPVPNGLPAEHAALTEPMAVGRHAVRCSRITKRQAAYVIGCGPIGLAVISMLKASGVRTIVASDLSPIRRAMGSRCGADVVVDPQVDSPFAADLDVVPDRLGIMARLRVIPKSPWWLTSSVETVGIGFDTMEKLRRIPIAPWWWVFRAMHRFNKGASGPVVFECAGVPGMIDRLIHDAPMMSQLIILGGCATPDTFRPRLGTYKESGIRFATGYDAGEFRDTLHMMADGKVDVAPLITGTVGLAGVNAAFDALEHPEQHVKILIDPCSPATTP
jgi:threonine dehydrogenase-like Zn-dependent dehydrogenase